MVKRSEELYAMLWKRLQKIDQTNQNNKLGWRSLTLARKSLWILIFFDLLYLTWNAGTAEKRKKYIWIFDLTRFVIEIHFPEQWNAFEEKEGKKKYSNKYWPREIRYTDIQSIKLIGKWQRINKQRSGLFVCSPIICM